VVVFALMVLKHDAFNTRTYDFGRFAQAIWNTLHGRFLFTTIDYHSILGNHFSPYLALLAPLYLLWPDERVLFLVQAASVAAGGLVLTQIVRARYPSLAAWFMAAFCLNPAIHEMALFEFRRSIMAFPFLALALLDLFHDRRPRMLIWLGVALLAQEDIGLVVAGFGLFFLAARRSWAWGFGLITLGLGWAVVVSLVVIPSFRTPGAEYPQLFYYDYLGKSYAEILSTLRHDPLIVPRQLFDPARLHALWRLLLPLGVFLPFLAPTWLLVAVPSLLLLQLSSDAEMFGLEKWYVATVLPACFAAIAVGLGRQTLSRARMLSAGFLATALLGYWLFSPLPGGRQYQPGLYRVTGHDRLAQAIIAAVPEEASIAAQPDLVPHLVRRENVYHYPWARLGIENLDYLLFDSKTGPYPFGQEDLKAEVTALLANPDYEIAADADGILLLRRASESADYPQGVTGLSAQATWNGTMALAGFQVATPDEQGVLRPLESENLELHPGQGFRVDLYWETLDAPQPEHTVSVRLVDENGRLWAQHDGIPAQGSEPTSGWQPGQRLRDVHYLTLDPATPEGNLTLQIVVYDSFSGKRSLLAGGLDALDLLSIFVQP
jgi:uncharacterized membrane protein